MLEPSVLAFTWYLFATPAPAATLQVTVKLPAEAKVDAEELFVLWPETCPRKPGLKPPAVELSQKGARYTPRVAVAQLGARLVVRNEDKIQHNSFALKNVGFDSGVQKPGTSQEVKLDRPGLTQVLCRIHPKMLAEVLVLPHSCFEVRKAAALDQPVALTGSEPKSKIWLWSSRLKDFQSLVPSGAKAEFAPAASAFTVPVAVESSPASSAEYY